jgi:hypothetical protein
VLVAQFTALDRLAPGRVIAGLGTGDHLSQAENRAYGIAFPPAATRRAELVEIGRELVARGLQVWAAGGLAARTAEALAVGAALNLWDADATLVAERAAALNAPALAGGAPLAVTWGGPPPPAGQSPASRVAALRAAGATWAVFGWPVDLEELGRAGTATDAP